MDADSIKFAYEETVNRVMRDARAGYFDLALVRQSREIVVHNREVVEQFLHVAEARYGVGQGTQADVLKAQTQLSGMSEELLLIDREEAAMQAQLRRLRDDVSDPPPLLRPTPLPSVPKTLNIEISALRQAAIHDRPQLRGLQSLIERNDQEVALLQRDFYPDFDVRLSYGKRERTLDGARRDDMVSLTVAVNLPIWRKNRIEPRISEALAMRNRTRELYRAQSAEVLAALDTQFATAQQSRLSADLIEAGLLPQSRLAVESSLAAYRVGRVDFSTLLDNQMIVYRYELERARTAAAYAKALAEIDFLVGKAPE
jgi:outer membrane protein TolC